MTKHFESVWLEAEKLTKSSNISDENALNKIQDLAKAFSEANDKYQSFIVGEMLYYISALSQKHEVNVFTALEKSIRDHESELLGAGEDEI